MTLNDSRFQYWIHLQILLDKDILTNEAKDTWYWSNSMIIFDRDPTGNDDIDLHYVPIAKNMQRAEYDMIVNQV